MVNNKLKLVKSATAFVIGATVLTGAFAAAGSDTAFAKNSTSVKVSNGKLVNKSTGKVVKGYKTYNKALYKDGKKFTGLYKKTYYKAGKKATGTYKSVYYKAGKAYTGVTNKTYYKAGKKATGTYKNVYYKTGKAYTGVVNKTYYKAGKKATGLYKGVYYKTGKAATGIYNDKLYISGNLSKGLELYKEQLYKDGSLNKGLVVFKDQLYKDAALNKGLALFKDQLYKDATLNKGFAELDGKFYFDAALANDTYTVEGVERAFEKGVEVGAKVKAVEAINAKQVTVTFNKSFGDNGLSTTSYTVRDLAGNSNAVKDVEKTGDRTVVLTLEEGYRVSTDLTVTVDGVYLKGSIKEAFPKFAQVINVNDTVAPKIVEVKAETTSTTSAQSVSVTLSEPIKAGAIFRINGKTATASAVTGVTPTGSKTAADYATTYVISGQDLAAGKSHEVEILNAEDYADNKVVSLTQVFSVTQDTTVATGEVSAIQDNKVLVKFDKAVVASSLSNVKFFTYDGTTYHAATVGTPVKADKLGKEWIFTLTDAASFYGVNDTTENILVKVQSGVVDTAGNAVKPFDATVSFKQDVTGPSVQGLTYDKNSKGEVTKLYFAYDEAIKPSSVTGLLNATHVVVTDLSTNKVVALTDLLTIAKNATSNDLVELASDGKTIVVTLDTTTSGAKILKNGNYAFELQSGFVTDDAATPNKNKKETVKVNFGTVANEVTATPAVVSGTANKFTVTFTQDVTADSAKDPANYSFNNKSLPIDTVITVVDSKTVEFTIPAEFIAKNDTEAKIVISNIKPKDASATFTTYVGVIAVTDNTAPVATGSILSNGIGQIAFSELVTPVATDFAKLKVDGLELNSSVYTVADNVTAVDGSKLVTITVDAVVSGLVDGFSYQYIDVDGDGVLNLTKDIVLQKVQGAAPATWTTTADLSKVKSVEVVTNTTTATVDANGNKLATSTPIVLKK